LRLFSARAFGRRARADARLRRHARSVRINPAEAAPYPGVMPLLDEISRPDTPRGDGERTAGPRIWFRCWVEAYPEIWGSHGWERLQPHGEYNVGRISRPRLRYW